MSEPSTIHSRSFLRAPMNSVLLFEDDGHVLKALTKNISEGGLLIKSLPKVPEINIVHMMISVPQIPKLSSTNYVNMERYRKVEFDQKIIRVRCRMVRSFQSQSPIDQIFEENIAFEITKTSDTAKLTIKQYVEKAAFNLVYLLGLFESHGNNPNLIERARVVASVLGYEGSAPLMLLRQKILHDYQSLESL